MTHRHVLVCFLLLAPAVARAQDVPEQLLSARTHLYLRWDGQKAHRDVYLKTALGKMMQGDTGKMIDSLFNLLHDNLKASLTVKGLLDGAAPEKVEKMQAEVAQAARVLAMLGDHGVIVAAEAQSVIPPGGQVTLIVPNCGKPEPLFAALRLAAGLLEADVKQVKVGDRAVSCTQFEMIHVGWWLEGKHAVVLLSTEKTEAAVKTMTGGDHPRLTGHPMFKRLNAFKEFETSARAFLDVEGLTRFASVVIKEVKQTIEALGLDSVQAVTFLSGYEGDAERGLTEIHYNGPRKGLAALYGGKTFKLSDAPPLPVDTITWSMSTFDLAGYYDAAVKAVETVVGLFAPNEANEIKEFLKQADQALGINIRKDLIGAFGDQLVQYTSPSEGVFTLSQTIALKVKAPEKLLDTLDQAAKGLMGLGNVKGGIKKKKYRGVEVREVQINEMGFFFLPTYAVVGDWLVLSFYPQPVQGFILRTKNELPSWKPDEAVLHSLDKLPKEFLSVSVSDPRPSVKQVLTLAPLIGSAVRSFFPETKFDPSVIPNAHEACKHLFPNVTVTSDDGKTTRIQTRASLGLPFDVAGLDAYILGFGAVGLFSAFADK